MLVEKAQKPKMTKQNDEHYFIGDLRKIVDKILY